MSGALLLLSANNRWNVTEITAAEAPGVVGSGGNPYFGYNRVGAPASPPGAFGSAFREFMSKVYIGPAPVRYIVSSNPLISSVSVEGLFASTLFSTITINGKTLNTSTATHSQSGGNTFWDWTGATDSFGMSAGNTYSVALTF